MRYAAPMQEAQQVDAGEVEAEVEGVLERQSLLGLLRDRDHTQGNLLVSVLVLALPSVFTTAFSFGVFQVVELGFLGRLGEHSLAAAGSSDQILRQALMMVAMGMSVASQMMIARFVGSGRVDGAEHVAGQSFVLAAAIALFAMLTGGVFPERLVRLVAFDPEVVALATVYVRIVFLTFFAMISGQIFASTLNGAGDTTTPMLTSFIVTPISIFFEWALTFGHAGFPELGIAGIPLGSATGGIIGAGISFFMLFSGRCRVHLRLRHLVPDWDAIWRLVSVAWQPALHMLARSLMIMFFMIMAGHLGGKVQAAYTIGLRLEMLAIMLAFPIANACATLVGQNLGAGNLPRAWRAIWVTSGVELAALWPLAVGVFWFRHELVSFFATDPEVAALASQYLVYSSSILMFYGLYFVAFRTLQASGDMNSPMIISVGSAVLVGAPLGYYLSTRADLGPSGMWIANVVYALLNAGLMIAWLLSGRWTRRHV
jgi:putative MATE family efflux protein